MLMYKLLFISLSIIGIFLLIQGIKLLMKSFNEKIIVEIPCSCKMQNFEITKNGAYSIWQKGKLFQKAPIDKFKPVITNESTGAVVELSGSVFRTQVNNLSTGRTKLFSFVAPAGTFKLELEEGTSVSRLEKALASIVPAKSMNPASYFIQIRESKPGFFVVFGIILLIIGFGCIITGIILAVTFKS